MTENNNSQNIEEEKRVKFSQLFQDASFYDLVKKTQPKVSFYALYVMISFFIKNSSFV